MAATGTKANIQKLGLQNIGLHLSKSSHVLVNKKTEINLSNTIHFRYTELWQSLNSDWGVVEIPQVLQPIDVNVDPDTKEPNYTLARDLKSGIFQLIRNKVFFFKNCKHQVFIL